MLTECLLSVSYVQKYTGYSLLNASTQCNVDKVINHQQNIKSLKCLCCAAAAAAHHMINCRTNTNCRWARSQCNKNTALSQLNTMTHCCFLPYFWLRRLLWSANTQTLQSHNYMSPTHLINTYRGHLSTKPSFSITVTTPCALSLLILLVTSAHTLQSPCQLLFQQLHAETIIHLWVLLVALR